MVIHLNEAEVNDRIVGHFTRGMKFWMSFLHYMNHAKGISH